MDNINITKGNCDICLSRCDEEQGDIYYINGGKKTSIALCKKHLIELYNCIKEEIGGLK